MVYDQQTEIALQQARQLIQAGRYREAQAILITINHPLAIQWLARINMMNLGPYQPNPALLQAIDDEISSRKSQITSATIVILVSIFLSPLGVGLILFPFALFNYFRHKGKLGELQKRRLHILSGGG